MDAISKAVDAAGGVSRLAEMLGIRQSAVSNWRARGSLIPAEYCPTIERGTAGRVRCEELRPDVDWSVLRNPV